MTCFAPTVVNYGHICLKLKYSASMELIWNAIATGTVSVIIVAAAMKFYFGPYLSKKASNLATKEDLKNIVEQTYKSAYAEQKGKNLATHEDIQKLIDQVRETERVKADIADRMWDRQIRWNYKRDVYIRLIETIGDLRTFMIRHRGFEQLRRTRDMTDLRYASELEHERKKTADAYTEASVKLLRTADVAPLAISPQACQILYQLMKDTSEQIDFNSATWDSQMDQGIDSYRQGIQKLQDAARDDLGYGQRPIADIPADNSC